MKGAGRPKNSLPLSEVRWLAGEGVVVSGGQSVPNEKNNTANDHYQSRQAHTGAQEVGDHDFDCFVGPVSLSEHD
jgi:hypothetical protein